MPLDDILWKTGIKRKAIIAAPTICRFCNRNFLDKWYKGELVHKVRCPHCNLINAKVDIDDWMKSYWQGLRHSIGTYGELGFHIEGSKFKKAVRDAYGFQTDEEVEAKLREFEYGIKMKQKAKTIQKERERRITIKRKGEEPYHLRKKKSDQQKT